MADKATRLTIRLGADARAWLQAEAAKRGLHEAAFARMLIYERMNGAAEGVAPATAVYRSHPGPARPFPDYAPAPAQFIPGADSAVDQALDAGATDEELAAAGEERAEDMEIAPDADGGDPHAELEALMQAGPTFFDELASTARSRNPDPAPAAAPGRPRLPMRQQPRGFQPPAARDYRSRMHGLQPSYGPGSLTRPVGVNHAAVGANTQGDGFGNVHRDNYAHFGIAGTRSR